MSLTESKSESKIKSKTKKVKLSNEVSVSALIEVSAPALIEEVSVPAPLEPTLTQTVPEPTVETSEESNTEILFSKLINQFQDIQLVMKTLHSNLKVLQKEVLRERKESKKKESKIKKKSDKKRSPSGFAKPTPITDELAIFIGCDVGTQLARTEVTSKVIAYVKAFNLQNPANKKQIVPDSKLKDLLKPGDSDIVTFFNLQTYLKKHFLPATVTATETTIV